MRARYKTIARVEKTHGKRGEVVTVPVHGLPPMLREGMRVALVPPSLDHDRWQVVEFVSHGGSGQLVGFAGVDTIADADKLVGRNVLACVDDLPEDINLLDVESLLDREVEDVELGPLGVIAEVMVGPANDVWLVEGPFGEVMLPVIDSVVSEVPDSGPIVVRAPRGSIEESGGGER